MAFRGPDGAAPRHPADLMRDAHARQELALIRAKPCPTCEADPNAKCVRADGREQRWTHVERTRLAFPIERKTA